jgi:hypothetical protein
VTSEQSRVVDWQLASTVSDEGSMWSVVLDEDRKPSDRTCGLDPMRTLALAALLVFAGVLVALAMFTVSLAATAVGLATIAAGIGVGMGSMGHVLRNRLTRFTKGGSAEDLA